MTIETLLDLYDHMAWADATVWSVVLNDDRARTDDKLRTLLRHVHTAQRFFLRVWRGDPMDAPFPVFDQMPSLCDWARTYHAEVRAYLAPLTDASLRAPMPEAWVQRMERLLGASPAAVTLGDTMMHVPLHTLYHRGQANMRIRELGCTPPLVDHIAWVWQGRPAAVWQTGNGSHTSA